MDEVLAISTAGKLGLNYLDYLHDVAVPDVSRENSAMPDEQLAYAMALNGPFV